MKKINIGFYVFALVLFLSLPAEAQFAPPQVNAEATQYNSTTKTFDVVNTVPANSVVQFNSSSQATPPLALGYPIFNWLGNNTPIKQSWNFGDSSSPGLKIFTANPAHKYSIQGVYNPTVTAYDSQNQSSQRSISLTVSGVNESPDLSISDFGDNRHFVGEDVRLFGDINDPESDLGYPVFNWLGYSNEVNQIWNFGGGAGEFMSGFMQDTKAVYDAPGDYWVQLSAYDGLGAVGQTGYRIVVHEPMGIVSPVPGSTITESSVDFTFEDPNPASPEYYYLLSVGTDPYFTSHDPWGNIAVVSLGKAIQTTVNVPLNGQPLYVRLWRKRTTSAFWMFKDYVYQTQCTDQCISEIVAPDPEQIIYSNDVTFEWNNEPNAQSYYLRVQTERCLADTNCNPDIVNTDVGSVTSYTVNNIGLIGESLVVDLFTRINGIYEGPMRYFYDVVCGGGPCLAELTSHQDGDILTINNKTLEWSIPNGVEEFHLTLQAIFNGYYLGTTYFNQRMGLDNSYELDVSLLDGHDLYVKLWTRINNIWYFNEYTLNRVFETSHFPLVANGTRATSAIVPGGQSYHKAEIEKGNTLFIGYGVSYGMGGRLQILDGANNVIQEATLGVWTNDAAVFNINAQYSGPYTIRRTAGNNQTQYFYVNQTKNPVTNGHMVNGQTVNGWVPSTSGVAVYSFDGVAGEEVDIYFQRTNSNGSFVPVTRLYGPDGEFLSQVYGSWAQDGRGTIRHTLTKSGQYSIWIYDSDLIEAGSFMIRLFKVATVQDPTPGSNINTSPLTLSWNPVEGAQEYWLTVSQDVSLDPATAIIHQSAGSNTSETIDLPHPYPPHKLYVRLQTKINGSWVAATVVEYDYQFLIVDL